MYFFGADLVNFCYMFNIYDVHTFSKFKLELFVPVSCKFKFPALNRDFGTVLKFFGYSSIASAYNGCSFFKPRYNFDIGIIAYPCFYGNNLSGIIFYNKNNFYGFVIILFAGSISGIACFIFGVFLFRQRSDSYTLNRNRYNIE